MANQRLIFVTGTDTDVGKTVASLVIMEALVQAGFTVAGLKPVAAGGVCQQGVVRNEDALQLQAAASSTIPYSEVNPVALVEPIAPHIAAVREGVDLSVEKCLSLCQAALRAPVDCIVIEGAGGWRVPLNANEYMSDLAAKMDAAVILVVGMRLGCLNHALLTAEAIKADGLKLLGWIANDVEGAMPERAANLETLKQQLGAPLLAELPYSDCPTAGELVRYVDREALKAILEQ